MKVVNTNKAPKAIGPYSQAIEANGLIITSGQLPIDPATGEFAPGGIKEQTRQSITNAKAILEEAGIGLGNVMKTTVFLSDMNDFAAMNEVYAEFFSSPFPARSSISLRTVMGDTPSCMDSSLTRTAPFSWSSESMDCWRCVGIIRTLSHKNERIPNHTHIKDAGIWEQRVTGGGCCRVCGAHQKAWISPTQ